MKVGQVLAGGAQLVRTQPKAMATWGIGYLIVFGAAFVLLRPMFADMLAFQQKAMAAQAANLPPPPLPAGFFLSIFAIEMVFVLFAIAVFAAAVRATALGGDDRFGFLRFGRDELRLVGLAIIVGVLGLVASVVLGVAVGLLAAVIGAVLGGTPAAILGVTVPLFAIFMLGLLWAEVRISLAGALTVLRGRIVLRDAWRLTHGRVWTLLGAYLVIGLAYCAVTLVFLSVSNPALLSALAGGMQPAAMQAAAAHSQAVLAGPPSATTLVIWLFGGAFAIVFLTFVFGAIASAAITLDRERLVA